MFNPSTYPNFLRFLKLYPHLKSAILPTEMTFSVSRDRGRFEWAGNNLRTVFCQPARLVDRKMWRLLYDVLRFNTSAQRLVEEWANGHNMADGQSIGTYLAEHEYSDSFRDNYLIASVQSTAISPLQSAANLCTTADDGSHLEYTTGQVLTRLPRPNVGRDSQSRRNC